jgi:hypothetical protein
VHARDLRAGVERVSSEGRGQEEGVRRVQGEGGGCRTHTAQVPSPLPCVRAAVLRVCAGAAAVCVCARASARVLFFGCVHSSNFVSASEGLKGK